MNDNTCIRVLADINQINECRRDLQRVGNDIVSFSRALDLAGNEVRLKILFLIYKEGEMCPCDLSDVLGMKVPAISQHLRKLKDGGILQDKKVGQTIFYSLVEENSELLIPILKKLMKINEKILVK
ncbi:MAG: winged helix-turn-helix transcriptional regulator [Bacteroidetes bacterium]|nr:winged helix-turn-helix transcriptional regulator [Bacteroidota bacterium]